MADALAELADRGIHLRNPRPSGEHYTTCPQCSSQRKKKTATCLSVKLDDDGGAVWHCSHCGWTGNVPGRQAQRDQERRQEARQREYKPAARPAQVTGDTAAKMIRYFAKRGISEDTLTLFGVHAGSHWFPRVDAEAPCIVFPYRWRRNLVNHKYRSAKGKHFMQDKDTIRTLFNVEALADSDVGIIVEGEIDVLSFHEAGLPHVVSLPDGAPSKPVRRDEESAEAYQQRLEAARKEIRDDDKRYDALVNCADDVAHVKRWIVATDGDWPGETLAHQLAHRLGAVRCARVAWPDGTKDGNEALVQLGAERLRQLVDEARPFPIAGLVDVRPGQLIAFRHAPARAMFEIGIPSVDRRIRLRTKQLLVITGFPGDGKSQWCDFMAVQTTLRYGWRWAMCSPEHVVDQHASRLAEIYLDKPFVAAGGTNAALMTDDELRRAEAWIAANFAFIVNDDEDRPMTLDWVLDRARAAWIRDRIRGLVIDPWNEVDHQFEKGKETDYIGQALRRIRNFARNHDLLAVVVAHPKQMQRDRQSNKRPVPTPYDIAASANWFNKPDINLTVHRPDPEKTDVELHVQKVKWRDQGQQGVVQLQWSRNTGRYLPSFAEGEFAL